LTGASAATHTGPSSEGDTTMSKLLSAMTHPPYAPHSPCRSSCPRETTARVVALVLLILLPRAAGTVAAQQLPDCNPAAWHEVTSPRPDPQTGRMPTVSGAIAIERDLHITSGPPGGCPSGMASWVFFRCPPNGVSWPSDWTDVWWEAGVVAPLQVQTLDTTEWCYLFRQGVTSEIATPFGFPPDCCQPVPGDWGPPAQTFFTIDNPEQCCRIQVCLDESGGVSTVGCCAGDSTSEGGGGGCSDGSCTTQGFSGQRPCVTLPNGQPAGMGPSAHSSDGLNPVLFDVARDLTATDGPLGPGWNHNYNARLSYWEDGDGAKQVTVARGLKRKVSFEESYPGSDLFIPLGWAANYALALNRDGMGEPVDWTLTLPERTTERYALAALQGGDGRLLSVSDRNGNATTLTYDGNGRLTTITSPANRATTLQWTTVNGEDRLGSVTDAANRTWQINYTAVGVVSGFIHPDGGVESLSYNESGDLTGYTDGTGHTYSFIADNDGRVTTLTGPAGNTLTISYPADPGCDGYDITVTDANGNVWTYHFDGRGRIQSVTDPLGYVYGYSHDGDHHLTQQTAPVGAATGYQYDASGNATSIAQGALTTTLTYDALNQVVSETDPGGASTWYMYDGKGNVLTVTKKDSQGAVLATQTFTHNPQGQKLTAADAGGNTTSYQYDQAGNLTGVTDALGNATTFTYSTAGDRTSVTDPLGNTTQYEYDTRHRVTKVTHPGGAFRTTTYSCCLKTAETDENGKTTTYEYNANSRLTKVTDPLGNQTQYQYDNNGNRVTVIDPSGHATAHAYDVANRLTTITYADGAQEQFEYDAAGRKTASLDPLGRRTEYQYDDYGRLVTTVLPPDPTISPDPMTITRTYDDAGNVLTETDANGNVTQYQYDAENRRTRTTFPDGAFETYTYDPNGNLVMKTDARGVKTMQEYDALNRRVRTFVETP